MTGAFEAAGPALHEKGLAVIPTGGADGKTPLVNGWGQWKRQSRKTVELFASKFPDANIGILTGPSQLTIVDADDEKTLADSESRFGKSPLVTRSPRGGGHLYFKSCGERNANLRAVGLNVDIRGAGGVVIAPPSVRPGVGAYRIERGTWDDLRSLPSIDSASIPRPMASPRTNQGERNNALFRELLRRAGTCESFEALKLEAAAINAGFSAPLPPEEAAKTLGSVWRLKLEERIIGRGQQRIQMLPRELESLSADAFYFAAWIRRWHGARDAPFALVAKAMARAEAIPGWGRRRYEAAILELRASRFIERVHKGGSKAGDPSLYRMGARSSPNITNTPPPASPPGITQAVQAA